MKLIEPITNLGALSTNDAPLDALETWAPTGRDLLNYLGNPVFDVNEDLMIIVGRYGGIIYSVNITTGDVTDTEFSINEEILEISISPSKNLFYVRSSVESGGNTFVWVRIFNTSTVTVETVSGAFVNNKTYSGGIEWAEADNKAYLVRDTRLSVVNLLSWTINTIITYPSDENVHSITSD